mgnify:CR=1 FL=1
MREKEGEKETQRARGNCESTGRRTKKTVGERARGKRGSQRQRKGGQITPSIANGSSVPSRACVVVIVVESTELPEDRYSKACIVVCQS